MAELTIDDVRRAVQTAAGGLQTIISDIRTTLQTTRTDISRMSRVTTNTDIQYRLTGVERALTDLNQFMQRIDISLQNTQPMASSMQQNQVQLQRMEQRLANLEQLTADISNYLHVMHETNSDLQKHLYGRAEP